MKIFKTKIFLTTETIIAGLFIAIPYFFGIESVSNWFNDHFGQTVCPPGVRCLMAPVSSLYALFSQWILLAIFIIYLITFLINKFITNRNETGNRTT